MNYTFFAISCYILMRSLEVLLKDSPNEKRRRVCVNAAAFLALYAAVASMVVWFVQLHLLGFDPTK